MPSRNVCTIRVSPVAKNGVTLTPKLSASIRAHLASQRAYGSDRFRDTIERHLSRALHIAPRGRPKRASNA